LDFKHNSVSQKSACKVICLYIMYNKLTLSLVDVRSLTHSLILRGIYIWNVRLDINEVRDIYNKLYQYWE